MARKVNLREAKGDKGRNALHAAAAGDHLDVCRFLVEELGLDVDSTTEEGACALVPDEHLRSWEAPRHASDHRRCSPCRHVAGALRRRRWEHVRLEVHSGARR